MLETLQETKERLGEMLDAQRENQTNSDNIDVDPVVMQRLTEMERSANEEIAGMCSSSV